MLVTKHEMHVMSCSKMKMKILKLATTFSWSLGMQVVNFYTRSKDVLFKYMIFYFQAIILTMLMVSIATVQFKPSNSISVLLQIETRVIFLWILQLQQVEHFSVTFMHRKD